METRNRFQLQSWFSALLLLAIGLFGWCDGTTTGEVAKDERATLCKAGQAPATLQGREARGAARKTPASGSAQMDFHLGNTFTFGGFLSFGVLAESFEKAGRSRFGESFRERAPPAAV